MLRRDAERSGRRLAPSEALLHQPDAVHVELHFAAERKGAQPSVEQAGGEDAVEVGVRLVEQLRKEVQPRQLARAPASLNWTVWLIAGTTQWLHPCKAPASPWQPSHPA